MAPRISPRRAAIQRSSSFEEFRRNGDASPGEKAFWDYATIDSAEGLPAEELIVKDEYRVLSKATSGGGFLVPTDTGELITAAARAASAIAQVALEMITADGGTLGMALAGTHGTAAWTAESGGYTPSDETITQASLGAHKAATKIIVSEELRTDEAVQLDQYLASELGGRIGALQENAFSVGNGTGKPLGITDAGSGYTVSTAATGSSLLFKPADILQFYKALGKEYRRNATWIIAADDFASLAASADTAGGLVFPSLQFDPPSLYGRPVLISGDMPAPAVSAISLAFGDWQRAYCIRRVQAIGLQRQDELHSDSGQTGYKMFARVDGRPLLPAAAILGKHSAT
jgi:HK97 family phage major capsid protein